MIDKKSNNFTRYKKSDFLPTSKEEMEALGWDQADVIIFSGDAYVDHPSFGSAVIGRILQAEGYKVAIVPQPNWRDDLRDFKKLGEPRLFFGISAGAMDSMVNHYTANRRLRHDDAYTAGGRHGMRPDYPTIVYSNILRELFPNTPIIVGGIEASLRRVSHYDYWQDRLRPSILADAKADMIVYGMGERTIREIANNLNAGRCIKDLTDIPQTALFINESPSAEDIVLHSYEECLADKRKQAMNFKHVEIESNKYHGNTIWQKTSGRWLKINPMYPPMTSDEIDASFDLPYTRVAHPRYKGKVIPAYEMIRHSINMHRGCFGGCAFCTISAHQGKFIASRSKKSIMKEVRQVVEMEDFKGYISDLGGPSANMYGMRGKNQELCSKCRRKSCLFPSPCKNMDRSHARLLKLYDRIADVKGIRHAYIGSGIRYDLFLDEKGFVDETSYPYLKELILEHTSGRLKVAPEHTEDSVLKLMAKPSFKLFERLRVEFDSIVRGSGRKCELVPYFISGHPGCGMREMQRLSRNPALKGLYMDQVQDFTPTPMTTSSVMFYTGLDPKNLDKVFVERDIDRKREQKSFFFRRGK